MDERELKTLIDAKIRDGIGSSSSELSQTREDNLDRYFGELYGYEQDGESKVTTREVMETVEWAMPSIMRVFASSANTVEFDPIGPEDEQAAKNETEAVNHVFNKDNEGFYVLHTWIKSALMMPVSYVKAYWDEEDEISTETYEGLTAEQLSELMEDPELEATEQDSCYCVASEMGIMELDPKDVKEMESAGMSPDMMGAIELFDVKFKRTRTVGKAVVEPIPEEEVIVDNDHSRLSLKDCECVIHRTQKSYSDLIALGYDKKKLDRIGSESEEGEYNSERVNRRFYSDEQTRGESDSKANRKYWVNECYIRVDFDDDDYAELRRVVKIGTEIFENEETDDVPVVALSSILVPHKHINICLSDLVKDLQEIKTTITRQLLNNLYKTNKPRTVVGPGVSLDDLLDNSNDYIRAEDINQIRTEPTTPIIGQVIPALEMLEDMKETRTGISKNTMGLDADVLAQSTKGAYLGALEQANQRLELIVRVIAETGLKELFLKIHTLMCKHGQPKQLKMRGEWQSINPQEWRNRTSMTVKVGIGLGNRDFKMAAAQMILGLQEKLLMSGNPSVTPMNVYNAAELLTESAGEVNVSKYFTNPEQIPPKEPQPDINMMMLQLQKQIEDQKAQIKTQELFLKGKNDDFDQFMEKQRFELEMAKEGRERAKLELEHAVNIPGGLYDTGDYSL